MPSASELVLELFLEPKNVGDAVEPRFVGRAASFQCGAALRISLHIGESQRITEAKFKAAGCSVLIAAASLLTEQVKGQTSGEAASLGQLPASLEEQLGILESGRSDCAALACEALVSAIRYYSGTVRDEWEGDEALICTCFGVSESVIEREIRSRSLVSIEDVTRVCNAGAGCRSCYPLIQDILDDCDRQNRIGI
jgi:NifU-like protein